MVVTFNRSWDLDLGLLKTKGISHERGQFGGNN
jgi:hypothetical protein